MTKTILDESAVSEIEKRIDSFPLSPHQARALCATVKHLRSENVRLTGLGAEARLSHQEDTSMIKNYDDFRAGMLRAADMARNEFKRAPEAAKGHDCVYMGGYEDACDHLSVVIAQAAVIDSVRIAGSQPDWQYHIALLLPDDAVEDQALLKIYQVVEHELGSLQSQLEQLREELTEHQRVLRMAQRWEKEMRKEDEQLRAENEALRKELANSEKYQGQLLDSDSTDQVKPGEK